MAWLAPPYDTGHGSKRLPGQTRRRSAPLGSRQSERNESKAGNRCLTRKIALIPTVAEIRTLARPYGATVIVNDTADIACDGVPGSGDSTDQDFALVIYNGQVQPDFRLGVSPAAAEV